MLVVGRVRRDFAACVRWCGHFDVRFAGAPKTVNRIGAEDQDVSTGILSTLCSGVLYIMSVLLLIMTFPLSLAFIVKVRIRAAAAVECGVVR